MLSLLFRKPNNDENKYNYSPDDNHFLSDFERKVSSACIHLSCYSAYLRPEEILQMRDLLAALHGATLAVKTDSDLSSLSSRLERELKRFEEIALSNPDNRNFYQRVLNHNAPQINNSLENDQVYAADTSQSATDDSSLPVL